MTTTPTKRGLTRAQVLRLVNAIDESHIETKQGLSYIAQHQARAEMTRIFGFGNWDSAVETMELVYEEVIEQGSPKFPKNGKAPVYYIVCYRASVRVNIRDYWGNPVASFVEYHAEENAPQPNRGEAHALAVTSVESYALRRALIGLGDRLGLGLYDDGKKLPLVVGTLQLTDPESPLYVAKDSVVDEPDRATQEPGVKPGAAHQAAFNSNKTTAETHPAAPQRA